MEFYLKGLLISSKTFLFGYKKGHWLFNVNVRFQKVIFFISRIRLYNWIYIDIWLKDASLQTKYFIINEREFRIPVPRSRLFYDESQT